MSYHKITNSIGVYDIYKLLRKNKWLDIGKPVTEKDFYAIIRQVNDLLVDSLVLGKKIILPHRLGEIELRKTPKLIKFKDGKLINNLPVDWKSTLLLWKEDVYSKRKKTLVRFNINYIYSIDWNKKKALFTNKTFYKFRPVRSLKIKLKESLLKLNVEAYLKHELYF